MDKFHDVRICRFKNGKVQPGPDTTDLQVEAVIRDVGKFYAANKGLAGHTMPGGDGTDAELETGLTGAALAAFLQANWPGVTTESMDEYYWYILPTGERVKVCTQDKSTGTLKPVEPSIAICFEMKD